MFTFSPDSLTSTFDEFDVVAPNGSIFLEFEVIGDEASDQVNYAIKKVVNIVNEKLIAITKDKQKNLVIGFM